MVLPLVFGVLAAPLLLWALFASMAEFTPALLEVILVTLLPHYDIARDDELGLYLRRHYLTPRTWKRKIFLHHIIRSDTDLSSHDHQWNFWSFILFGHYIEHVYHPNGACRTPWCCERLGSHSFTCRYEVRAAHPGTLLRNKAEHSHWIEIVKPVWSLVFVGEKRRAWGFWVYDPKTGRDVWVRWDRYLGVTESFDPNDVYPPDAPAPVLSTLSPRSA